MKVALSNIPVYYMSLFKMPSKVILIIEKYQRDLLWEGRSQKKDHLVKWDIVVKPKEPENGQNEGEELGAFRKWSWRFVIEQGRLWNSIILSRYGLDVNVWDCNQSICPFHSLY